MTPDAFVNKWAQWTLAHQPEFCLDVDALVASAVREALEKAANVADNYYGQDGPAFDGGSYRNGVSDARSAIADIIRSLAPKDAT